MQYLVLVMNALPRDEEDNSKSVDLVQTIIAPLQLMPTVKLIRQLDNGEFITVEFTDGNSVKFIASEGFVKYKNHSHLYSLCERANIILLYCDRANFKAAPATELLREIGSRNLQLLNKPIVWALITSDTRDREMLNEHTITQWQHTNALCIPDIIGVRIDFPPQQIDLLRNHILEILKQKVSVRRPPLLALLPEENYLTIEGYLTMTPPGSRPPSPGPAFLAPPQAPPMAPPQAHPQAPPLAPPPVLPPAGRQAP